MKLASLKGPARDGTLVVVSRDLARAVRRRHRADDAVGARGLGHTWSRRSRDRCATSRRATSPSAFDFAAALAGGDVAAPLPRAYEWLDGSAYLSHVERVRRARNDKVPESYHTRPADVPGRRGDMMGARDPDPRALRGLGRGPGGRGRGDHGRRADGRLARRGRGAVRLLTLVNDVSFRRLIPAELAKGFGFVNGKGAMRWRPWPRRPTSWGRVAGRPRAPALSCP